MREAPPLVVVTMKCSRSSRALDRQLRIVLRQRELGKARGRDCVVGFDGQRFTDDALRRGELVGALLDVGQREPRDDGARIAG